MTNESTFKSFLPSGIERGEFGDKLVPVNFLPLHFSMEIIARCDKRD